MSRLLFAAARGARIQYQYSGDVWLPETVVVLEPTSVQRRIHPGDEHLQYGPISTALRDWVLCGVTDGVYVAAKKYLDAIHPGWVDETVWHSESQEDALIDYRMTLLFAAELLADEGL